MSCRPRSSWHSTRSETARSASVPAPGCSTSRHLISCQNSPSYNWRCPASAQSSDRTRGTYYHVPRLTMNESQGPGCGGSSGEVAQESIGNHSRILVLVIDPCPVG